MGAGNSGHQTVLLNLIQLRQSVRALYRAHCDRSFFFCVIVCGWARRRQCWSLWYFEWRITISVHQVQLGGAWERKKRRLLLRFAEWRHVPYVCLLKSFYELDGAVVPKWHPKWHPKIWLRMEEYIFNKNPIIVYGFPQMFTLYTTLISSSFNKIHIKKPHKNTYSVILPTKFWMPTSPFFIAFSSRLAFAWNKQSRRSILIEIAYKRLIIVYVFPRAIVIVTEFYVQYEFCRWFKSFQSAKRFSMVCAFFFVLLILSSILISSWYASKSGFVWCVVNVCNRLYFFMQCNLNRCVFNWECYCMLCVIRDLLSMICIIAWLHHQKKKKRKNEM